MTTQELHIQLDLLLQKVNSHWNNNFLPQEKDFFLNREILKFIKQRINPSSNIKGEGAYDTIKRISDLSSLVTTVEKEVISLNQKEDAILLPFDFLFHIDSEIYVTPVCTNKQYILIDKPVYTKNFTSIIDINSLTNYTITLTHESNITTVFDLSTLPSQYLPQDNIEFYKKNFIITNCILNTLRKNLPLIIEVEFDKFTNNFILSSIDDFTIEVLENTNVIPVVKSTTPFKGNTEEKYLSAEVRIIDNEFYSSIKKSYLSGSKDESVIALLKDKYLIFPKTKNVVRSKVILTYFRIPNKIDVLLNYNSELPNTVLEEVLGNTVQTIKGVISSDTYQKYVAENLLIE